MESKQSGIRRIQIITAGAIIIAIALILWTQWNYITALLGFLKDREAISQYLAQIGMWGPLLYVAILGMQVISAIIPGHALMVAAGYLYGFKWGLALNALGAVGASQLAFLISRRGGQGFVKKVVPANVFTRWEDIIKRQGVFFFLISFWFPIIPSNATNYLAGLSPISFWTFFAVNFVGRLPGLIMVTLIGAYGLELSLPQWGMLAAAGIVAAGLGRYMTTKINQRYALSSA